MKTEQTEFWQGEFGKEYTDRNTQTLDELSDYYRRTYGIDKDALNGRFLSVLPSDASILEVGCNVGLQLQALQRLGFRNLSGIEIQSYAVEKARQLTPKAKIVQGSGFDLPFAENSFDLVYTHGVLIHIGPADLPRIMAEMIRVSRQYVWGFEYFAEATTAIHYRGHEGFMWKADYCALFQELSPSLQLVAREIVPYVGEGSEGKTDCMYLLEKRKP